MLLKKDDITVLITVCVLNSVSKLIAIGATLYGEYYFRFVNLELFVLGEER